MAVIGDRVSFTQYGKRQVGTLKDLQHLSPEAVIETEDGLIHIVPVSSTESEKSIMELLGELKARLDDYDRLTASGRIRFDDPRVAEQDRLNSLPEPEGDATEHP